MKYLATATKKYYLTNLIEKLNQLIDARITYCGTQFATFAIFGVINYLLYYLIWSGVSQHYENFILRLVATFLCLGLLLKNYWPTSLKKWFPLYWYSTLTYCLSFFFTYMLLHNPESKVWIMTFTSVIFWLVLLTDLTSAVILLFLGIAFAIGIFAVNNDVSFIPHYFIEIAPEFIGCLVVVLFFANNKARFEQNKIHIAESIGSNIAHELRTPLSTIDMGIEGAKKYFPILLDTYQLAQQKQLLIPQISSHHFTILTTLFDDLQHETQASNIFIDMLLHNVNQQALEKHNFEVCKISHCVQEALQRYPFTAEQSRLIVWSPENDFEFTGSALLIIHTLFNLFKNAIYAIEQTRQGTIHIWQSVEKEYNILYFKDTATGIPRTFQNKLFQRFASNKRNGTGLGLAFCKRVMQKIGGDISCYSLEGKFTEFQLKFPKAK